jgi:hypothetical protein
MSMSMPTEGRATLARSYRNLPEREIRARLEGPMPEAERVTAKAELLRRHAGDNGPDTALATGFEPTSAFDEQAAAVGDAPLADGVSAPGGRSAWPWLLLLMAASIGALGWVIHARLAHLG